MNTKQCAGSTTHTIDKQLSMSRLGKGCRATAMVSLPLLHWRNESGRFQSTVARQRTLLSKVLATIGPICLVFTRLPTGLCSVPHKTSNKMEHTVDRWERFLHGLWSGVLGGTMGF